MHKHTLAHALAALAFLSTAVLAAPAVVFPVKWHIYLPVPASFMPSPQELNSIPDTLAGQKPIVRNLDKHQFDLAKDFGGSKDTNHAWLFAELNSPADMEYRMGCGADWWFTFYVNGERAETTVPQGNVLHPPQYTDHVFTTKLRKGRNILAVRFRSGDASSVISLGGEHELKLNEKSPQTLARQKFYEDRGVPLTAESVVPPTLDDKIKRGLAPKGYVVDSYWRKLLLPKTSTLRDRHNQGPKRGTATLLSAVFNGAALTATVTGTPALTPDDEFYVILWSARGQELYGRLGTLRELNTAFAADGTATVIIPDLLNMPYGAPAKGRLESGIIRRDNTSQAPAEFAIAGQSCPGDTAVLRIADSPAGPTPMLNGKPFFFNCFTIHPYIPERSIPTGMEGPNSPVNVVASRFGGNSASDNWWYGPGQYDFTTVDWTLNGLIRDFPDSKIAIYLWCHPGLWYSKLYPERLSVDSEGHNKQDYYVAKVSFSNQDVQKDTCDAVAAFVNHCEQYFASRIVIYNLMGGISCEWQGWNSHSGLFADYSTQTLKDFQAYAKARGLAVDHVPTPAEHQRSDGGIFRNPVTDRNTMLYDRFYSEAIADFVDQIAGTVKANCHGDKLVGAYYGYLMEYSNLGYTGNRAGHNNLTRLLNSANIDFFLSPQSYAIRAFGNPNADMKPYGAIRLAGKFSIMEDDTRTHMLDQCGYSQALNQEQTLKFLTRNLGMYLCHRMPVNQLGEHGGDEMATPELHHFYEKIVQAGQYIMEQPDTDPTQIAAVIDETAIQYLSARRKGTKIADTDSYHYGYDGKLNLSPSWSVLPLSGEAIGYQRMAMAHFGAPVDVILLDDVAKSAGKYKIVIFLNAYRDTPALRQAFQVLREKNVTIVSLFGSGFIGDNGVSTSAISGLLGMNVTQAAPGSLRLQFPDGRLCGGDYPVNPRFTVADPQVRTLAAYADGKAPAVVRKGNTVFYGGAYLDEAFIRELAREQGIHLYLETGDNLYAGARCLSLHAKYSGTKNIALPRKCTVVDALTDEIIARDAQSFTIDMKAMDSRIFLLK